VCISIHLNCQAADLCARPSQSFNLSLFGYLQLPKGLVLLDSLLMEVC
jgi:hypothetical protein